MTKEPVNLEEMLSKVEAEYSIGSSMFEFEDGKNYMRVLAVHYLKPVATHFFTIKGGKTAGATCYGEDNGCPHHGLNAPLDENGDPKGYEYIIKRVKDGKFVAAE